MVILQHFISQNIKWDLCGKQVLIHKIKKTNLMVGLLSLQNKNNMLL